MSCLLGMKWNRGGLAVSYKVSAFRKEGNREAISHFMIFATRYRIPDIVSPGSIDVENIF